MSIFSNFAEWLGRQYWQPTIPLPPPAYRKDKRGHLGDRFLEKTVELVKTSNKTARFICGAAFYPIASMTQGFLKQQAIAHGYISKEVLEAFKPKEDPPCTPMNMIQKSVGGVMSFSYFVVLFPVVEDFLFRELLQTEALNKRVSSKLEKISPSCANAWKGVAGQMARTAVMTAVFTLTHCLPYYLLSGFVEEVPMERETIHLNAFYLTSLGLFGGLLQERLGFFSAVGLHATHNAVRFTQVAYKLLIKC